MYFYTHVTCISQVEQMFQKWNDELAEVAQRWADQCTFGHDTSRNKLDGTYVGQNAYLKGSSTKKDKATVSKLDFYLK